MGRKTVNLVVKNILLDGVLIVYSFAFASLYHQLPGLYGNDGIMPINFQSENEKVVNLHTFLKEPTLVIFSSFLGLSRYRALELICLAGLFLSCLAVAFRRLKIKVTFFLLYLLYLSCVHVGGIFLWYQWDILLLEVGFAMIFLAPYIQGPQAISTCTDGVSLWLIRWIFFRLMFSSGAVKLLSHCPSWWSLSALSIHYQGACLPTPFAWYAHHMPLWFHKFSDISTFFVMLICTLFVYCPVSALRAAAFFFQITIQFLILLTGNFNFINILTIVMCFVHFANLSSDKTEKKKPIKGTPLWKCFLNIISGSAVLLLVSYQILTNFFGLAVTTHPWNIDFKINFTYAGFTKFVDVVLTVFTVVAYSTLFASAVSAFHMCTKMKGGNFKRVLNLLNTCVVILCVFSLFLFSLVPLSSLSPTLRKLVPASIHNIVNDDLTQFHLVNHYGLFARVKKWREKTKKGNFHCSENCDGDSNRIMTGQNGRDELIIEGSDDQINWKEYEFLYKPGDPDASPPFIAPHQPRLDWQMWFAALSTSEKEYWYLQFIHKLLNGSEAVAKLMKPSPFGSKPPKYIRTLLYNYRFASSDTREKKWWDRRRVQVWHYPVTLSDDVFDDLNSKHFTRENENMIFYLLNKLRMASDKLDAFYFTTLPALTAIIAANVNALLSADETPSATSSKPSKLPKHASVPKRKH